MQIILDRRMFSFVFGTEQLILSPYYDVSLSISQASWRHSESSFSLKLMFKRGKTKNKAKFFHLYRIIKVRIL